MATSKPSPTHLDGYVRVSQVRGRAGDSFISPKVQRDQIETWAKLRGVQIAAWHEDLDQSGGKLERPGLAALLARIDGRETGGLVVAKLDRLSRLGVADALKLIERITSAGGTLASADGDVDLMTASGEFQLTVMLALARMERRRLGDSWDMARSEVIGDGVHFRAPFGYIKPGRRKAITVDPAAAPLVLEIFQRRAAGESWPALAAFLNARHAPATAARWTNSTVRHIIENRAYTGTAYHGEHEQAHAHEAIVSTELFEAANRTTGRAPTRGGGEGSLLTGLIRCAGCRHSMTPAATQGGGRKDRLLTYRCRRKHGGGDCQAPSAIKREVVDALVERTFLERYRVALSVKRDTRELGSAERALERAEAELAAYRDDTSISEALEVLGASAYTEGLRKRSDDVLRARQAVSVARTAAIGLDIPDEPLYRSLSLSERRALLRAGVGAVFVRQSQERGGRGGAPDPSKRTLVLWPGEVPDHLPGQARGAAVPVVPFDW